jgi:GR25 family glycosyltransferase involved in LPS biosynthesis
MHPLNRTFERVYVLNIDSATGRMERTRAELTGIDFRRFSAVTPGDPDFPVPDRLYVKKGMLACTLSHIAILEEARRDGLRNALIFEDDVVLDRDFVSYDHALIADFMASHDWALFYLGCMHVKPPVRAARGIVRVTRALGAHAYAVNGRFLDSILASLRPMRFKVPIDVHFAFFVNSALPCYCTLPRLYVQAGAQYSQVEGRATDLAAYYKDTVRDGALHGRLFPLVVENVPWGQFVRG